MVRLSEKPFMKVDLLLAEALKEVECIMLTKRIIPCLDVKEGRVVKGIQFVQLRDAGDPVELRTIL